MSGVTFELQVVRVESGALHLKPTPTPGQRQGVGISTNGSDVQPPALEFDECLWCTQASAASWLKATGIPTGGLLKRKSGSDVRLGQTDVDRHDMHS